jgi:hypothetical protein
MEKKEWYRITFCTDEMESVSEAIHKVQGNIEGFRVDGVPMEKKYEPEVCNDECRYRDGICEEHGTGEDTPSPTPETHKVEEWEKEFELRFQNWRKDPNFWEQDMVDFIRSLLATREAEVVERVRGALDIDNNSIHVKLEGDLELTQYIPVSVVLQALTEKHKQEKE